MAQQQPATAAKKNQPTTPTISDEDLIYGQAQSTEPASTGPVTDNDLIYGQSGGDTRTADAEKLMGPLSDEEKAGIKKTESMFGQKGPDTAGDTFMKQTLRVPVNMVQGAAQAAAWTLKSVGLGVSQEQYNNFLHYRETEKGAFEKASAEGSEANPVADVSGKIAGELMMFSATGPAFFETKFAEGLLKAAPLLTKMVAGAAQGGVLSGSEAMGDSDHPGVKAFMGALGGSFGAAGAHAIGTATAKVSNALGIKIFHKTAKEAADAWTADNQTLARAFQAKVTDVTQQRMNLAENAKKLMQKAGLPQALEEDITDVKLPAGTPKSIQDAVQRAQRYHLDTDYFFSSDFKKIAAAGPTLSSGKTWIEANDKLLNLVMGDDNIKAERVYRAFSPANRAVIQKGIFYKALEKASTPDGKYDAGRLKNALDTPGVSVFFPGKDGELLKGMESIVHSSDDILERHPWMVGRAANETTKRLMAGMFGGSTVGGGVGYLYGGKEGAAEGAALGSVGGFIGYLGMIKSVNALMKSQGGRNLLSAAGTIEKGTPHFGKVVNHLAGAIWTPFDVAADPFSGAALGP